MVVSDSARTLENTTAVPIVTANSAKITPMLPSRNAIGNEDCYEYCGGRDYCECYLAGTSESREQRWFTLFNTSHDIFQDHDRVIHDKANGKHQAQQRDEVDRSNRKQ